MTKKEKNEKEETEKSQPEEKKVKGATAAISFLVIVIIFLAIIELWIYFFGISNPLVGKIASVVPYPAAIVDNKIVSAFTLNKNLEAARSFYENQNFSDLGLRIDFSTPDGKKRLKIKERRILTKMIEDALIEKEANERGIKLTDEEIASEVSRKIEQFGSKQVLEENMDKLYGWEMKDFEKNIVKPDMYAQKLYEDMRAKDESYAKPLAKIKQAKEDLDKAKDFESVVPKYSEGDSVKDRGDLGWFGADEMLPEIAEAVSNLEKGKTSGIIESSLGYHIIRLEDKKTENDVEKFHLRQIFVRIPTMAQWLSQKEKEVRIFSTIREYQWNENIGEIQFTNKELKAFEENLEKNYTDDISVIF